MISKRDAEVISQLRRNARKKITVIAKQTNIPVTTIYDRVRINEKELFKRHVTLIDFSKLGFHARANISFKVQREQKDALEKYLMAHTNVNSLTKVNFSSDFLAEVVFKNVKDVDDFVNAIQNNFKIEHMQIYNIIQELKREEFLSKPEHFALVS